MSINQQIQKNKIALPLIIVYCISTAIVVLGKKWLQQWGADPTVIIIGNLLLFLVSVASLFLYQRAMLHATTNGFLKNTYGGLFLKLLICIFAVMLYVFAVKEHVNKPALFACIFLYFLYTVLEMRSLLHWNKARRNA